LHCLTNFFLRGASHPEELVGRAAELGYRALAITDECSLAGILRAHVAAKAAGSRYVSVWIKRHEPAAFLAAMLNSQPLGFYAPSRLVQDAPRHGGRGAAGRRHRERMAMRARTPTVQTG
jgi:DNA polymerase III alpha subunit